MTPERRNFLRLCLALGRTANELEDVLTERERREWLQFAETESFGEARMDWRFGNLIATIVNLMPRGASARKASPADFVFLPEVVEHMREVNATKEEEAHDPRNIATGWGAAV